MAGVTVSPSTTLVRVSLWASAPLNLAVAAMLAAPDSPPARLLGLRGPVEPVYAALAAWLVALFGLAYAWMALRPTPDRSLLCLGAVGKAGAFVTMAALWVAGAARGTLALAACADLVLAVLWLRWLAAGRAHAVTTPARVA